MTTQPPIITLDDDEKIIEPGFVSPTEMERVVNEGIFPAPLKVEEEVLDETNRELPGALVLSPSGELLKRYITWEGFGDHHIEVFDNWIFRSAANNISGRLVTFPDGRVACFENLKILHPRYTRDGRVLPLTPKLAREQGVTYGSDWHVDVVMRRGSCNGEELDRRAGVCIGTIPTMLKSRNCILHGKTPRELALYGEDPKDPGGYFIVSGVEKVVLLQEQLAVNKIFLMNMDTKGSTVARMTANTTRGTALIELALDKKTRTVIKIRFPSMRGAKKGEKYKSVNVLRIFRLCGISDFNQIQNIISLFMKPQHVKKCMLKLTRNLVDFVMFPDDVEIMIAEMDKVGLTQDQKIREILRVLETDLFPHLNNLPGPDNETVTERDNRIIIAKLYLLAIMIARFLEHLAGYRPLDNRDSWSNKRTEGAGRMMEALLRNAWRKTLGIVQAGIETGAIKDLGGVVEKIRYSVITDTFHDSFITSNWGVKGTQMKNNVAQTLVRDSVTATFAHINTVDVGISRTDRQQSLRRVQDSQWGFIDPASTPEGENAGILKNLCLTAKVSLERSDTEIIRLLIGDQAKGIVQRVSTDLHVRDQWPDKLLMNGKFLGWCNADETGRFLTELRRSGGLPQDMSVIREEDWLYVDIGPSRLVRPLLIVDADQQLALDRLKLRGQPNHLLLTRGAMEYISCWEQEYIKVATSVNVIRKRLQLIEDANETFRIATAELEAVRRGEKIEIEIDGVKEDMTLEEAQNRLANAIEAMEKLKKNQPYTHCELDPLAILGIAGALIPWPNHNQAPRNTYQISMGKQALGVYHSNHLNRFDGKTKILAFPNRPMVETEMYDVIGLNERGPGENTIMAFMAYPNTEEDSLIMKKEFLDNGGMRIYKYITYKTIVKHSGDVTETLKRPDPRPGEPTDRYKYIQMLEPGNPMNGLPMIGAPLRQGDCIIGKIQHVPNTNDVRNESVILRVGDEGVVEKVLVTSDNKTTVVTVKLRIMRVPQEGDKFAPRNAQKATVGLVMSDIDMPVTESGIVPDIIVNTHCFTADTPVLLKNGMSRPLVSMAYNGGDKVWSLDKIKYGFVSSTSMGYESKGVQDIVKVTLSDGRIIRCTPTHRFPILAPLGSFMIRKSLPINEITKDMILLAGIDGVLDINKPEEELAWQLNAEEFSFSMSNTEERDKSLAFARLLGLICTDGCMSYTGNTVRSVIVMGTYLDTEVVLDDIELLTGKRPTITKSVSSLGGSTLAVGLPAVLARCLGSLQSMTIGRRTTQLPEWPAFLLNNCPKSVVREFLGGLFGGDGWAPYLTTNVTDGPGNTTFNPPAISLSACLEFADALVTKMQTLIALLEYVGVLGSRVEQLKPYTSGDKEMVACIVQLPRGTEFGDKVGYRYCVQKMYRMAAYQSYMRYLANVKYQNDNIIKRASEIYDLGLAGRSLSVALDMARAEIYKTAAPFNDYYSNATLDQLRNRRRPERYNELVKWDYSRVEDAVAYLHKIGAYHWFRGTEGKAEYIVLQDANSMPYFRLRLHDVRPIGKEEVFDLGIFDTHVLTVNGISAENCIPSRMTMSYPMEILAAKHAAMRGVHINGGAFHPFEFDKYRTTMKDYGMHEFGYEKMRSGTSGKPLQALIYGGPIFFQALKHHVKDKVQVRSIGQVKPMTRQPPKGRGNRGGLRFGEMERDAGISHGASAFIRERLMKASDAYQTAFCKTCGTFAINDATTRMYKPCRLCGDDQNFGRCTIPYAYKLLIHLLAAISINLRPEFMNSTEYAEKIFHQEGTGAGVDINDVKIQLDEADEGLDEELEEFADEGLETDFADVYD